MIISSEVIASRKVSIFKLFPPDCITLYYYLTLCTVIAERKMAESTTVLQHAIITRIYNSSTTRHHYQNLQQFYNTPSLPESTTVLQHAIITTVLQHAIITMCNAREKHTKIAKTLFFLVHSNICKMFIVQCRYIQHDQINMAVLFWYFVKSDDSVRYCTVAYI